MQHTIWKSAAEIRFSLEPFRRIAIFSCGACANLSGTGGHEGLNIIKGQLEDWDKEVVAAEVIIACCVKEIMRQALLEAAIDKNNCDAVVVLSCGGGVKCVALCQPQIPIIPVCDTIGSSPITSENDSYIIDSPCKGCGTCILGLTGGICPVSYCPLNRINGPCAKAPATLGPCAVRPDRQCIWRIIEHNGTDLESVAELIRLQKNHHPDRMSPVKLRTAPPWSLCTFPGHC